MMRAPAANGMTSAPSEGRRRGIVGVGRQVVAATAVGRAVRSRMASAPEIGDGRGQWLAVNWRS